MVNRVQGRGSQVKPPVRLIVGDIMSGTPFPREGRHGDYWLVRVRGGIMGLLIGNTFSIDPNRNVRVSLKRIDEPDIDHPNKRHVFEFVSQSASTLDSITPAKIDTIIAASPTSQTKHITDKSIPPVKELAAFRQYGEGLLRTTINDLAQLKSRMNEWLGMAEKVNYPEKSAIEQLIPKLKRRVEAETTSWRPSRRTSKYGY